LYISSIEILSDSISSSTYLIVKDSNNLYRQLFFEDKKSLALKYDWIKENQIGGVGIWALGYDNGYSELWDLLTEKFSEEQNETLYNNEQMLNVTK
jgi:spore germination protein YaaH